MSFFTNKKFLFKLIAVLCVCLAIFNFVLAPKSEAKGVISALGGTLLDPIVDLTLVLGDGVMEIIQQSIMGTSAGLIFENNKSWIDALKTAITVIISLVIGLAIVAAAAWLVSFIPFIGWIVASGLTSGFVKIGAVYVVYSFISSATMPDNIVLPTLYIGPEEIFKGQILLFDANIFDPEEVRVELEKDDGSGDTKKVSVEEYNKMLSETDGLNGYKLKRYFYEDDEGEEITTSVNNSAQELKNAIAKWYYVIRNIALIGLMLVLMYIGIRMLLSSIASEKAKYKQMLGDWLVAMCLIFVMHYFMVFLNVFVENIVELLASVSDNSGYTAIFDESDKLIKQLKDDGYPDDLISDGKILWKTNLMGKFRVEAQRRDGTAGYVGYTLCYIVLIFYTVVFTFTYLKRLLYILFLTVIAPFVAMTYPMDKIKDGHAQAFEMWMKEYICNLIIQPFHLILYVIFVSMAFDLAAKNVIYSLVVIGFMIPAEKFLRKMFGFDKASSPGFLAGAGGIAMAMTAMKTLGSYANGGKGGNKKTEGGKDKIQQKPDDFLDRSSDSGHGMGALLDDAVNEGQNIGGNNGNPQPGEQNNGNTNDQDSDNQNGGEEDTQSQDDLLDDQQVAEEQELEEDQNQGFGKNAFGEYYDPSQDDFDPNYDQTKNLKFNKSLDDQNASDLEDSLPPDNPPSDDPSLDDLPPSNPPPSNPPPSNPPPSNPSPSNSHTNSSSRPQKKMSFLSAAWKNTSRTNSFKDVAGKTFKTGIRDVAKATMAGAGATIGLAAGIASGSPGDAVKYGLGGMYAGSAIGSGTANRAISGVEGMIENIKQERDEIGKTQYGSREYKQIQNLKKDEMFRKNKEMRKLYADRFNLTKKEDIDKVMDEAIEYRKYGVTDNSVIMKAMGLDTEHKASKKNIAAARLSLISKTQEDLNKAMERYERSGASRTQVEEMRKNVELINF